MTLREEYEELRHTLYGWNKNMSNWDADTHYAAHIERNSKRAQNAFYKMLRFDKKMFMAAVKTGAYNDEPEKAAHKAKLLDDIQRSIDNMIIF